MSVVVGINCAFHESSAAIVVDGKLEVAVAEERFNRKKRGKKTSVNSPNELPFYSIEYCLAVLGIKYGDVDYWAISFDPELRLKKNLNWEEIDKEEIGRFSGNPKNLYKGNFGSNEGEVIFNKKIREVPDILTDRGAKISIEGADKNFFWIPHHLCHASSSFYSSGFSSAAILILDGGGEYESAWLAKGKDGLIIKLDSIEFPNSLGFLWEKISEFCGLGKYGAGKLMGLASFGDPKKYKKELSKLIWSCDSSFETNEKIILAATSNFDGLEDLFKIKRGELRLTLEHKYFNKYADIAASLQKITEEIVFNLLESLKILAKEDYLCLAGGVFLNCLINQRIIDSELFDDIYICPAATDDGTAVGAALEISSRIGELENKKIKNWFLGKKYSDSEIEQTLVNENMLYRKSDDVAKEVAHLIYDNKIIAWFQGGFEFGPRALGGRSILANPMYSNKEKLNSLDIKDRENFRPVCPSVIKEDAKKYFEIDKLKQPHNFMLATAKIRKEWISKLPALKHPGNLVRLQAVDRKQRVYHNMIKEFGLLSGVSVVANTSFNSRGEPIVSSPQEALKCFKKCRGIDYLAMGDFIVKNE